MCWSEQPTGVFESSRASAIVDKIFDAFHLEAGMNVTRWVEVVKENAQLKSELAAARAAAETYEYELEKQGKELDDYVRLSQSAEKQIDALKAKLADVKTWKMRCGECGNTIVRSDQLTYLDEIDAWRSECAKLENALELAWGVACGDCKPTDEQRTMFREALAQHASFKEKMK